MTALASYSTGTVSVADGGTTVTAVGAIWSGTNARPGDVLQIGNFQTIISDIVDTDEATIPPWGGGAQSGVAYKIWHVSPQRFAGAQAMADVSTLVAALNKEGFYWFVDVAETEPDPSLGNDGQYASQPTTGKLWIKAAGVWDFLGIYRGFNFTGDYNGATTYSVGDVQTTAGSSYVWINPTPGSGHTAPNATYWQVLASKGDTGNTGPTGAGYGGTSTTSLAIGTGSKAFTTQSGLAYTNGARVRASSAANTSNWMEGLATYSSTTLTIQVDKTNGSGTLADWNFNIVGQPGAGDLSSANNLSDLANTEAALTNLGVPNYLRGYISGLTLSNDAVAPNTILDIAAGVATSDDQAVLMKLASAYTKTTGAWAVGSGNGALDTGSVASSTWYHVFLIKRTDTGIVDILFSTSPTAPTMPTNYTKKRRIGSFKTDGSSNILGFVQLGNDFTWKALGTTYYLNNPGTSAVLVALNVPLGVAVKAKATFFLQNTNNTRIGAFITSQFQTDVAANVGSNASIMTGLNGASGAVQQEFDRWTNTSQQIRYRLDVSNASTDVFINTVGWFDPL